MKKMMLLLGVTLSIFTLTGCTKQEDDTVYHDDIVIELNNIFDSTDGTFELMEDIVLPNVVNGALISYSSSVDNVIDETGKITVNENLEDFTLTVTITKDGNERLVTYNVTINEGTTPVVNGDYKMIEDKRVQDGALVISGGASSSNLQEIDDMFVSLGGGNENIHILIVPTSSGGPTHSSVSSMKKSYKGRYGLTDDQFDVLNVTVNTKELADDPSEVAKVNRATAIWFTGGDQYLVTSSLWKEDGTPSLVLDAIFTKWDSGNIVIGGSSAGAAIMSEVMIGGGLSVGALSYDHVDSRNSYNGNLYNYGALLVNDTGFGFFTEGVVDQHFDARDRLGRLIEAAYVEGNKGLGFGVAENSAMIFNNTTKDISVIGEMFIVDTREATRYKTSTNLSKYENIKISLLRGHSTYNTETEVFNFLREDDKAMEDKTNSPGNQYEYPTNISQFTGEYDSLYDFISYKLLDNRKDYLYTGRDNLPYVSSYTIVDHEYYRTLNSTNDRIIYEKRFFFDSSITKAFYDPSKKEYSFKEAILDIIPLEDNLQELD